MYNDNTKTVVSPSTKVNGNGSVSNGNKKEQLSRMHIKKDLGNGVQINVFGDTAQECVELMCSAIGLCEGFDYERPVDEKRAAAAQVDRILHEAQVAKKVDEMICSTCGSASMKFINWNDKQTGEPRSNWKCEDCNTWLKKSK